VSSPATAVTRNDRKPVNVRLRLTIAAVVLGLIVSTVVAFILVRQVRMDRRVAAARDVGMQDLAAGRYRDALHRIGSYINHGNREEPAALYGYARSREAVEEPRGKHITEAIGFYRELLDLPGDHPEDADARVRLRSLYLQIGSVDELLRLTQDLADPATLSDAMAAEQPAQVDALLQRAKALANSDDSMADALEATQRYLELRPLDADALILTLQLARSDRLNETELAEQITADLRANQPEDPRALLALAADAALRRDVQEAAELAELAASRVAALPKDAFASEDAAGRFLRRLVITLDGLGLAQQATDVLAEAAAEVTDVSVLRLAVNRLARAGRHESVVVATESLPQEVGRSELQGLRVLSLRELSRDDEAETLRQELAGAAEGTPARAWAAVAEVWPRDSIAISPRNVALGHDAAKRLAVAKAALETGRHPHFVVLLAGALGDAGDHLAARQTLLEAAAATGGRGMWIRPALQAAVLEAEAGNATEVGGILRAARQAAPTDPRPVALAALFVAGSEGVGQARSLLEAAEDDVDDQSWLRAARVLTGELPSADAPEDPAVLAAIAAIARRAEQTELADAIVEKMRASGADASLLAVATGEPAEGDEPSAVATRLDRATARQVLEELSPENVDGRLRLTALAWRRSRLDASDVEDWKILRATAKIMADKLGESSTIWPIRLAQLDLSRPDEEADEAILRDHTITLSRITRRSPALSAAQLTLASLLDRLGLEEEVLTHLAQGVEAAPADISMRLALADRQLRAGQRREGLNNLAVLEARREQLAPAVRESLAERLAGLGEADRALDVLPPAAEGVTDINRLRLQARAGRLTESQLRELLTADDIGVVAMAGELLARSGDPAAARQAADRIATLPAAEDDEAEVTRRRVGLLLAAGEDEAAEELLREGLRTSPDSFALRQVLVLKTLQARGSADAVAEAAIARQEVSDADEQAKLDAFVRATQAWDKARQNGRNPSSSFAGFPQVIAATLTSRDTGAAEAAADAAVALATFTGEASALPSLADELAQTADVATEVVDLQRIAAQVDVATRDPERIERAAARAERAMAGSEDAGLARVRVDALAAARRPADAAEAARQWKERLPAGDTTQRRQAAIAEARLELLAGDAVAALGAVRPYVQATPEPGVADLLAAQARLQLNDPDAALSLLGGAESAPASGEPQLGLWLEAAAALAAEGSAKGLSALHSASEQHASNYSLSEQLRLGGIWARLASQEVEEARAPLNVVARRIPELIEQAEDEAAEPLQTAAAWERAGTLLGQADAATEAEAAYRRALQQEPARVIAANNLSMLLVKRGGEQDLREARELMSPLVAAADESPPAARAAFFDTLAAVAAAEENWQESLALLTRAKNADPRNPEWSLHEAEILHAAGRPRDARRSLREATSRLQTTEGRTDLRERAEKLRATLDE
jgi:hypothetical protein